MTSIEKTNLRKTIIYCLNKFDKKLLPVPLPTIEKLKAKTQDIKIVMICVNL